MSYRYTFLNVNIFVKRKGRSEPCENWSANDTTWKCVFKQEDWGKNRLQKGIEAGCTCLKKWKAIAISKQTRLHMWWPVLEMDWARACRVGTPTVANQCRLFRARATPWSITLTPNRAQGPQAHGQLLIHKGDKKWEIGQDTAQGLSSSTPALEDHLFLLLVQFYFMLGWGHTQGYWQLLLEQCLMNHAVPGIEVGSCIRSVGPGLWVISSVYRSSNRLDEWGTLLAFTATGIMAPHETSNENKISPFLPPHSSFPSNMVREVRYKYNGKHVRKSHQSQITLSVPFHILIRKNKLCET